MLKNNLWRLVKIGFFSLWCSTIAVAQEMENKFTSTSTTAAKIALTRMQAHHLTALSWQRTAATSAALIMAIFGVSEYISPTVIPVGIGGALGSITRYMLAKGVGGWMEQDYPYGTLTVNIVGSFVFGAISGWASLREETPDGAWIALVTTGFLGGFTTFSTFTHDTVGLAHKNGLLSATLYTTASVSIAIIALLAGESVGAYLIMY